MFKTLITTCLLTFSCASGGLKDVPQTKDLNVRNSYNTYNLGGCWCFKETDSYTYPYKDSGSYVFYNYQTINMVSPKVYYETSNHDTMSYITARTIEIEVSLDVEHYWSLHVNLGEESIYYDIDSADGIYDLPYDVGHLIFWFPSGYYVTAEYYEMWTCLFSQQANRYCTFYTGWYTFLYDYNTGGEVQIAGDIIVNNNYYNFLDYYNGNCYLTLNDNEVSYKYIDNGVLNGSNAILFNNVLINDSYYDVLSDYGIFSYVVEPVQYTFGDMIFNVVDAPIYMLSQLFSFKLFGVQFYVAFMGIVTVILIGFIVRKLI